MVFGVDYEAVATTPLYEVLANEVVRASERGLSKTQIDADLTGPSHDVVGEQIATSFLDADSV